MPREWGVENCALIWWDHEEQGLRGRDGNGKRVKITGVSRQDSDGQGDEGAKTACGDDETMRRPYGGWTELSHGFIISPLNSVFSLSTHTGFFSLLAPRYLTCSHLPLPSHPIMTISWDSHAMVETTFKYPAMVVTTFKYFYCFSI